MSQPSLKEATPDKVTRKIQMSPSLYSAERKACLPVGALPDAGDPPPGEKIHCRDVRDSKEKRRKRNQTPFVIV